MISFTIFGVADPVDILSTAASSIEDPLDYDPPRPYAQFKCSYEPRSGGAKKDFFVLERRLKFIWLSNPFFLLLVSSGRNIQRCRWLRN